MITHEQMMAKSISNSIPKPNIARNNLKVGDWVKFISSWDGIVDGIHCGEDMKCFEGIIGEVLDIFEGVPWVALGFSRTMYPIPERFLQNIMVEN